MNVNIDGDGRPTYFCDLALFIEYFKITLILTSDSQHDISKYLLLTCGSEFITLYWWFSEKPQLDNCHIRLDELPHINTTKLLVTYVYITQWLICTLRFNLIRILFYNMCLVKKLQNIFSYSVTRIANKFIFNRTFLYNFRD